MSEESEYDWELAFREFMRLWDLDEPPGFAWTARKPARGGASGVPPVRASGTYPGATKVPPAYVMSRKVIRMTSVELIVGVGSDQRRLVVGLPGVPRVGDSVFDSAGDESLGMVYSVIWMVDRDRVQVRVR